MPQTNDAAEAAAQADQMQAMIMSAARPQTLTSAQETPVEEAPVVETPPAESATPELVQLREELAALRKQMAAKSEETATQPVISTAEPTDFVTPELHAEILADPSKLNALLNQVVAAAREQSLSQMPALVDSTVGRQNLVRETVTTFYKENPELWEHRDYVGHVTNRVFSEDPSQPLSEVLKKVAAQVRANMNITKQAKLVESQKPAFGSTAGTRTSGPQQVELTPQQKQMASMLAANS